MRTVFILAIIAATCTCSSESSRKKRFEEQSELRPERIVERFNEREEELRCTWPRGEKPLLEERKEWLQERFCYILLGSGSVSNNELAEEIYFDMISYGGICLTDTKLDNALEGLRKAHEELKWWSRDDLQDVSGLSEGSQRNPQKTGDNQKSADDEWYGDFLKRFKDNGERELEEMAKRAKEEEAEIIPLRQRLELAEQEKVVPEDSDKALARSCLCKIIGLKEDARNLVIKRVLVHIPNFYCLFPDRHDVLSAEAENILYTIDRLGHGLFRFPWL
jgi:hypothetical protein